jgi:hypothetical protein
LSCFPGKKFPDSWNPEKLRQTNIHQKALFICQAKAALLTTILLGEGQLPVTTISEDMNFSKRLYSSLLIDNSPLDLYKVLFTVHISHSVRSLEHPQPYNLMTTERQVDAACYINL